MRQPTKKTIDEKYYSITPLNPMRAAKLMVKLTKALGPSMGILIDAFKNTKGSVMDAEIGEPISKAVQKLDLDEATFESLCSALLDPNHVAFSPDGDKYEKIKGIDMHFSSYGLLHMFKVIGFALEVNFGDFFGALADKNTK